LFLDPATHTYSSSYQIWSRSPPTRYPRYMFRPLMLINGKVALPHSHAQRSQRVKVSATGMDVSPHPSPLWLEILGLHLRRRGSRERHREFLQTNGLRGGSGVRDDGNRLAYQSEPPVSRHRRFGRQDSSKPAIEAG